MIWLNTLLIAALFLIGWTHRLSIEEHEEEIKKLKKQIERLEQYHPEVS